MSYGLTSQQRDCLKFISDYIAGHDGIAPSYDEIRDALGITSKSGVHRLIQCLTQRGCLRRIEGHSRTLEVVGDAAPDPFPRDLPERLPKLSADDFGFVLAAIWDEAQRRNLGAAA